MRALTVMTIFTLALGVSACGKTKKEAEADLAAKEAAAAPAPAPEPVEAAPVEAPAAE
jgi:hypothetical protein